MAHSDWFFFCIVSYFCYNGRVEDWQKPLVPQSPLQKSLCCPSIPFTKDFPSLCAAHTSLWYCLHRSCCKTLCITMFQCLIVKSCFPSSAAKPSSDLLDLQPDFSGAAGGAAPVPPAAAGGATAWGGEWVIQAWGSWGIFCGGFNLGCYCYMCILIINNCVRNRVGNAQNGFSWSDYTLKDTEILHSAV